MKPSLQFRLSQHLTLTPQLQQSIRLLQLSTVELNQEIDRLLMENPALEREDIDEEAAAPAAAAAAPTPRRFRRVERSSSSTPAEPRRPRPTGRPTSPSNWRGAGGDDEDGDRNFGTADTPTLRDHLRSQLSLTNLGRARPRAGRDADRRARRGRLPDAAAGGDRGAAAAPRREAGALEELPIALRHLQNLEPAGVGARSPGECLCLQLQVPCEGDDAPSHMLALEIAGKHLELLASARLHAPEERHRRRRRRAARRAAPDPDAQPAPRRRVRASVEARYVIPDVIVQEEQATCGRRASTPTPCRACASTGCTPRSPPAPRGGRRRRLLAAAGGALADQERAAALRHHPARVAGDRRPPAPLPRARRGRDAAPGAARNRRHARPAREHHLARHHAEVHGHAARHLRAEVLLRQPRRHRGGRRRLLDRDPRADQAAGRAPRTPRRRCRTRASRRSSASRASWWRGARSPSTASRCRFLPSTRERPFDVRQHEPQRQRPSSRSDPGHPQLRASPSWSA